MKKKISKNILTFILFISISAVAIVGGSFYFIHGTNEDVSALNKNFLSEIASQNASIMQKTVQIHLDKLAAISNVIGKEDEFSIDFAIDILQSESSRSSFKRMGYADLQGNAVTTDGQEFSIANREYFNKAIQGNDSVSDRLTDKVGGAYINVYAVPFYQKGEIAGVIFATNRNDDFIEILSSKTFGGEGFSYVIKKDGSPIAYPSDVNDSSSDLTDLFDEIDASQDGKEKVSAIKEQMKHDEEGFVSYTWNDVERLGAYCKIGIEDWYAVTLVPKAVITRYTDRIVIRNIGIVVLTAITFILLLIFIILQNRKSQKNLMKIAYEDELTGCSNLNAFKYIAQRLLNERKTISYICVKFDIENFKFINDRLGFHTGDAVLKNISDVLHEILDMNKEAYARISADEFIVMMQDKHENFLAEIRQKFVDNFNRLMGSDFDHLIRFHSGVYIVDSEEKDIFSIYEKVNYAHRQSKSLVANSDIVEFYYDDAVRVEAKRRIEIKDSMAKAFDHEEFEVHIQPKYRLKDELISGGEALVRWRQKDGSLLFPGSFIPLFEENGFIIKLDLYMFEHVCKIIQSWISQDLPLVCISVNFSRLHLYNANFIGDLVDIANRYQVPREYIELELTETIFFENEGLLVDVLTKAHDAGFSVSMDDFGSGYSSLGLLKNIDVDVIKVDRNFFVDDIYKERTKIVVENVMEMAKKLGIHTLAEGIEKKEHIDMLKDFGCDYVQGYYYAKPMPVSEFEERLKQEIGKGGNA
ncbi:bifunctional diguanylate cyclase/phosphodiesterase [Amedibacillus sp. YH-ame6]